jgi:O-antigen/teichoic acid export membrane protein
MSSSEGSHRLTFFRQSGWMMIATTLGGVFMWAVHVPAARMPKAEYGVLGALLQVLNLMLIPALGLQTVFAQQTAAAITEDRARQLARTVRQMLLAVFVIWVGMAALAVACRQTLLGSLKITNPAALWITVLIALAMLWWPILQGVLQGRQNFLWFGWVQILNGCVRFSGVMVLVWWLGCYAAGAMTAALFGFWAALLISAWHSRAVWLAPGAPVPWRGWLGRVVPLTLGLGASQFMMAADQVFVQSIFDREVTGLYTAAGTIGRALVIFTGPVMAVMFPKVVASAARAERTDVLAQALGATALLGGLAALACTVLPELPLRVVYPREYLAIAPLLPWFAWCMLPLTLANVLIGNLLAREQFAAVPWLLSVAIGYGIALKVVALGISAVMQGGAFNLGEQMAAFQTVVRTIGCFSSLLLAVAAWFTWGRRPEAPPVTTATAARG